MQLPKSAAAHYGITRHSLGAFGNASADRRSPINWSAQSEDYSVFQNFWTRKGDNGPGANVSRARWVLPDESVWVSPSVSEREVLGGGIPPCIPGAKRSVCGKPADGTRYPRSSFCECMFGDLQPFRRFCQKAAEGYDPWTHEGLAEMTKLAHDEGYKDFNPWSVEDGQAKPHIDHRKLSLRTDWTQTVRLTDPLEWNNIDVKKFRLLGPQDPYVCKQDPTVPSLDPSDGVVPIIGGTIIDVGLKPLPGVVDTNVVVVPMLGGSYTTVPKDNIPAILCQAPLTLALDKPLAKGGKWLCATKEQLSPEKKKDEGSALPLLALAAAAAYFLF